MSIFWAVHGVFFSDDTWQQILQYPRGVADQQDKVNSNSLPNSVFRDLDDSYSSGRLLLSRRVSCPQQVGITID